MLTETGLVTRVENNLAWVNTQSKLACSSCKVESTCGNGVLEKYLAGKLFVAKIPNSLNASVGDEVQIGIPKASVTKASLIVYLLSIVALFAGAMAGRVLYATEIAEIIGGLIGFSLHLVFIYFYNQQVSIQGQYVPKMLTKKRLFKDGAAFSQLQVKNL